MFVLRNVEILGDILFPQKDSRGEWKCSDTGSEGTSGTNLLARDDVVLSSAGKTRMDISAVVDGLQSHQRPDQCGIRVPVLAIELFARFGSA